MNGKKVLVTGGFGNLGSYIAKHLIKLNYEVTILTRKEKNKFENLKYNVIECNIENLNELQKKLNTNYDFCIHCASSDNNSSKLKSNKSFEVNSLGTANLLESLNLKKIKNFIYFSTFHVYGNCKGIIDEKSATRPNNDYALTHLFAEYFINHFGYSHNLNYTILRLTNSYGVPTFKNSNKWNLLVNNIVKMAYEKKEIFLESNGKAKRDFIGMNDVTKIVEKILKIKNSKDILNLSSGQTYEVLYIAKLVKKIYEKRYKSKLIININNKDRAVYPDYKVLNKKIRQRINFQFHDTFEKEIIKIFNKLEEIKFIK